jgi:hypothetical protein
MLRNIVSCRGVAVDPRDLAHHANEIAAFYVVTCRTLLESVHPHRYSALC